MENTRILEARKETIWNKDFISIFIAGTVLFTGQFMVNTLVPKYTYELGASATIVGAVSGMFALMALGIRPVAGPAMDYFRKNRLLSSSVAALVLSFVCYGCARSVPVIMAARLIQGVGIGVAAPLSLALASNTLPSDKMASGIGIFSLGQAVATAVGPTIGLKLVSAFGYNATFFVCAVMMVFCLVMTLTVKSEAPLRTERFRISLKNVIAPEVLISAVLMFFLFAGYACINYFIVIYGGLHGVDNIGLFFTAYAVCLLISRPFSGRIADKFGIDKTVVPGIVIFAAGFVLISISRSLPMFMLAAAVSAFGFGACEPSIQTMCMQLVKKERRGAAGNTNFIGIDCGNLVGPTLAGLLITEVQQMTGSEVSGYHVMYLVMVLPVLAALVIFLLNKKKLLARIRESKQNLAA